MKETIEKALNRIAVSMEARKREQQLAGVFLKPISNFIESVVMNTPTRAYTHQIYAIVNGIVIKKHYRKTLSSALKTQMRIIGGGDQWQH